MIEPAGSSRERKVFLGLSAALVAALLIAAREVLLPFLLALVVAYVLLPAVRRVERLRIPRWIAILLVYALSVGSLVVAIRQVVPRLVIEARGLAAEAPKLQATLRDEWLPKLDAEIASLKGEPAGESPTGPTAPTALLAPMAAPSGAAAETPPELDAAGETPPPFRLVRRADGSFDVRVAEGVQLREKKDGVWQIEQTESNKHRAGLSLSGIMREGVDKGAAYAKENAGAILKLGRDLVAAISRGIFVFSITLMLAAYMMLTYEKILAFFRDLVPLPSRDAFDRFLRRLDRGLEGVVRGQLVICAVNGVFSAIGFSLFGLKYWPILSVVAAVMSVIPIFGSILSSVPAVAIGLTQSVPTAVGVLAWVIGIHQLEANFLNPKIIGDSAKIHPVLVVFSLIVGEHFFQLVGALFAVPCMSIAQTIFLHFRETTMGLVDPLASVLPVVVVTTEGPKPPQTPLPQHPEPPPSVAPPVSKPPVVDAAPADQTS